MEFKHFKKSAFCLTFVLLATAIQEGNVFETFRAYSATKWSQWRPFIKTVGKFAFLDISTVFCTNLCTVATKMTRWTKVQTFPCHSRFQMVHFKRVILVKTLSKYCISIKSYRNLKVSNKVFFWSKFDLSRLYWLLKTRGSPLSP